MSQIQNSSSEKWSGSFVWCISTFWIKATFKTQLQLQQHFSNRQTGRKTDYYFLLEYFTTNTDFSAIDFVLDGWMDPSTLLRDECQFLGEWTIFQAKLYFMKGRRKVWKFEGGGGGARSKCGGNNRSLWLR